jgi:CAAX prenyl protease-like protein
MFKFLSKPWVPYVFPFLIVLICTEATFFVPQWRYQIIIGAGVVASSLLFIWREKLIQDAIPTMRTLQNAAGIIAGVILALAWLTLVHFNVSTPEPLHLVQLWPTPRNYLIIFLITATLGLVIPVVAELFWRSFLLRYFIAQNFKSIPVGTFNLFAFIMVTILTALATGNHTAYLLVSNMAFTGLTFWSKTLYCSIVAHAVANMCIMLASMYLGISFY